MSSPRPGRDLSEVRADDRQWVGAIATSWFWMVGAVTLSLVPVIIKERIGGGLDVEIAVNLSFASASPPARSSRRCCRTGASSSRPRPSCCWRWRRWRSTSGFRPPPRRPRAAKFRSPQFFTSSLGLRLAFDIFLFSAAAGLFVVPIFAADSGLGRRGAARARRRRGQCPQLHLDGRRVARDHGPSPGRPPERADGACRARRRQYRWRRSISSAACRRTSLAFSLGRLAGACSGSRSRGGRTCRTDRDRRSVIAVNHVSFLDAPILYSLMDQPPLLAIEPALASSWSARLFLRFAEARPLDPARPLSLARSSLTPKADAGRRLASSPPGRTPSPASLMTTYDGAAFDRRDEAERRSLRCAWPGPSRRSFSRFGAAYVGRRLLPEDQGDDPAAAPALRAVPRAAAPSGGPPARRFST